MGTIVDATIPTEQFALCDTFGEVPDTTVETVRVATPGAGEVLPFLWASAPDLEQLDTAINDDQTTQRVIQLASDVERVLYQIEWCPHIKIFVYLIIEEQGTLLNARGRPDSWEIQIIFPESDSVSSFYDYCQEHDVNIDINRVNDLARVISHGGTQLSNAQYEALSEALERDYYSVPRGATLVELSEQLGVSHQAVSERLRRGHQTLIESTLHDGMAPTESQS